ncbi:MULTISPECIES: four helix bundle protein [unclassified Empedobacter]|uniref:four helix bundle protein n=1 Tax=unclassified Empedobacter TaxID=2643773 RepID=UPI0025BFF021|nr:MULTISPECIES: four helix bundle protein [unclassified Empedobacter]
MKKHKDLEVWRLSIDFVIEIYVVTKQFPEEEKFGLTSQMRRASVSIPSNIAEGAARQSDKEFIQFLYIALGSSAELETQLIIAFNLKFITKNQLDQFISKQEQIAKMLNGLIKFIKNKN